MLHLFLCEYVSASVQSACARARHFFLPVARSSGRPEALSAGAHTAGLSYVQQKFCLPSVETGIVMATRTKVATAAKTSYPASDVTLHRVTCLASTMALRLVHCKVSDGCPRAWHRCNTYSYVPRSPYAALFSPQLAARLSCYGCPFHGRTRKSTNRPLQLFLRPGCGRHDDGHTLLLAHTGRSC